VSENDKAAQDQDLFRQAMADAEPLEPQQAEPFRRKRPPHPIEQPDYLTRVEERSAPLSEAEVNTGDFLEFSRPGVQLRVLQELRRGHLEPELELDLHGLTVAYAQETLREFLHACRQRRIRCARIIHGKGRRSEDGQPVLKRKVNYWLQLEEDVLAFCSATRRDGGTGAVYVLLRNPRKQKRR
jgi:DNA-nicking Smr family endonuclease